MNSDAEKRNAGEKGERHVFEHRRTLYCFVTGALNRALHASLKTKTASVW
jgi:hypothetical protein